MKINVPIINQRTQVGADGRAPEDGNQDCVPASLAAMAQALTGIAQNADKWHDDVYGEGYIGLQSPAQYVAYAAARGVGMVYLDDTPDVLVARAVAEINAGHPVLFSIPSLWGAEPPVSQFAHMVAGCDTPDADHITCMNPWTVQYETYTLAWWRERLSYCVYKGIWILSTVGAPIVADAGLGSGFAAYQTAHPEIGACVSGGEHVYADDAKTGKASFAAFQHAPFVLFYSEHDLDDPAKAGRVRDDLGGYTATALWNELVAARDAASKAATAQRTAETNAAALSKNVTALTQQLTQAKAALTKADEDLAAAESENANLKEMLAATQGQVSVLSGQVARATEALRALLAVVPLLRAALAVVGIK